MSDGRRTQGERSATTRKALIDASRPLFAEQGFQAVSVEAIVRAAGVTRGAMYHHFTDKTELFAAVFEAIEGEITLRIGRMTDAVEEPDPIELMRHGAQVWLDVCAEPEVQQIALLDAPAVLGYQRWREIGVQYGMGLVLSLVEWAIADGRLPEQSPRPLGHVLLGALDEAALYVARSDDRETARDEVGAVLDRLIVALAQPR